MFFAALAPCPRPPCAPMEAEQPGRLALPCRTPRCHRPPLAQPRPGKRKGNDPGMLLQTFGLHQACIKLSFPPRAIKTILNFNLTPPQRAARRNPLAHSELRKRPVWPCQTGRSGGPKGPFGKAKRPFSQCAAPHRAARLLYPKHFLQGLCLLRLGHRNE